MVNWMPPESKLEVAAVDLPASIGASMLSAAIAVAESGSGVGGDSPLFFARRKDLSME